MNVQIQMLVLIILFVRTSRAVSDAIALKATHLTISAFVMTSMSAKIIRAEKMSTAPMSEDFIDALTSNARQNLKSITQRELIDIKISKYFHFCYFQ